MKKHLTLTLIIGVMAASLVSLSSFSVPTPTGVMSPTGSGNELKKKALGILDTKCNVCHRKKNPFMVFNEKNMVRRAPKIYKMVIVERKMPKGTEIRLTNEEFSQLEKWLLTQNIY